MILEVQTYKSGTAENSPEPKPSIRELRQQLNISQRYLAGKLGISQRAYSNLENGHTRMTEYKARVLARELNTSAEAILQLPPAHITSSDENQLLLLQQRLRYYEKLVLSLESQLQIKTRLLLNILQNTHHPPEESHSR